MRYAKIVSVFSGFGFFLSFLSGLTSHSSILTVLLRALIFACFFALLGLLIQIVYTKFLADENSSGEIANDSVERDANAGTVKGQYVDLKIYDEELPEGDDSNHFEVGNNHQMLNDSDIKKMGQGTEDSTSANFKKDAFVPLRAKETEGNISETEAVHPDETQAVEKEKSSASVVLEAGESIDTLPDMDSIEFESGSMESSDSDEDMEEDDTFSGTTVENSNFTSSSDSGKSVQDSELMAKAISSILAKEDS